MGKITRRHTEDRPSPEKNGRAEQSLQRRSGAFWTAPAPAPAFFRSLFDTLEIGLANATREGIISFANPRFAEILGQPLHHIIAANLRSYLSAKSWLSLSEALEQGSKEPVKGTMQVLGLEGDAGDRIVRLSFLPIFDEETTTIAIVAEEVTEQLNTEEALEKAKASLQTLSARMLQVQDEERRRVARELHDLTGQEVSVAIMTVERIAHGVESGAAKALSECAEQLRKVESDIRTLSYVLHPPLLDEIGLGAALRWYLQGFVKRTGVEVDEEIPEEVPRFRIEKETALFRVIQEALTNVYRHSGSKQARVRLLVKSQTIEAYIEDRGHGFQATSGSSKSKPGVGMQSMRGRMEIVGGTLHVESDSHGTRILAVVPIESGENLTAESVAEANGSARAETSRAMPKRVLIVDDHDVARRGIRVLFEDQNDLQICGEAADGAEAVRRAKELKPDLVILDLSMPKMSGLTAATQIRDARLGAKILVYTSHSIPQLERNARLAGCDGYVVKSDASRDLLRATREILSGGKFYRSEELKGKTA